MDWSDPSCVTVNDGNRSDINFSNSTSSLSANWTTSTDANSGIVKYWYAIGTTSGATALVTWTDNGLTTSVTNTGLSLTAGQNYYYYSFKAINGAGLSSICSTNGVLVSMTTDISENENEIIVAAQPNPFDENTTVFFSQQNEQRVTIALIGILGKEIQIANTVYPAGNNSINLNADALKLAKGVYTFRISSDKFTASLRLVKY